MKKNILACLIPAVMMVSAVPAFAETVTVDGGKINFTGAVVAAPCAVDATSDGQTVVMGQVPANRLAAKGDASSAVPFTIRLTGCDLASDISGVDETEATSYTSASITFNGATAGDSSTLAISSAATGAGDTTSTAKNVGLQILQNNTPVTVDGSAATAAQKIYAGANEIPFSAAYVATADGVVAGSANSTVNFQVTYE